MAEKEFYRNGNVIISDSRFIVGTTTYAMSGVTSVKRGERKPSRIAPVIFTLVGLIVLFSGTEWTHKGIGIFIILAGIAWFRSIKTEYLVFLNSSSGESQALSSTDKNYIDQVILHLNEAIIYRG
ncbi:TPA: QacE [Escherichia coli]|uniref:DUF6232 family protein n=2 Tax=Escherichia coli TaxID=562 RepID=UPI000BE6CB54|nr:DUF6232 family protein [Escherichia coli]HAH9728812.1 QacE [Escherichia coli]